MSRPSTYTTTVELQDIDMTRRTSVAAFIGILLNIAGEDATKRGFGIDAITQENHTWVLSRFAVELSELPALNDTFDITTWIAAYNRLLSTRLFSIASSGGQSIGEAVSQWCMMDIESRHAVDLTPLHEAYSEHIYPDDKVSVSLSRRLPSLEATQERIYRVEYSDVDFNCHLNSLRYIDLMLNMLPVDVLTESRPMRIELQFIHECYLEEELRVRCELRGDIAAFEILKGEDVPAVRCVIEWR